MRHVLVFLLIFLLCISPVTALAEADAAALAEDVLASLAEGDFAAVFENSDAVSYTHLIAHLAAHITAHALGEGLSAAAREDGYVCAVKHP